DDDRRALLFLVRALRERGVERLLLDVGGLERLSILVDAPPPFAPRRAVELFHAERAERDRRDQPRHPERAAGREQPQLEQPAPREALAGFLDEPCDVLLVVLVLVGRICV